MPRKPPTPKPVDVLHRFAAQREREVPAPSQNTLRIYQVAARRVGPILDAATVPAIRRAIDLLRQEIAPTTINTYLAPFSAAWNWAWEREYVPHPWPRLRPLRKVATRKRPFTAQECDDVLAWFHAERRWMYPAVLLLWDAGSRVGETCALHVDDVDRDAGVVHFHRAVKGGHARRVPVGRATVDLLPVRESGLLFRAQRDEERPLANSTLRGGLLKALDALGLPRGELDLHSFRRAWVQDATRAGVPLVDSMRHVGHRSQSVHLRYQRNAIMVPQRAVETAQKVHRVRAKSNSSQDQRTCGASSWLRRLAVVRQSVTLPGTRGFIMEAPL